MPGTCAIPRRRAYIWIRRRTARSARYLNKLSRRCGVPNLYPHKLRHTFASIAITNGADIASVSEALGHSDKAITLRMYTHADQESISRAARIAHEAVRKTNQG